MGVDDGCWQGYILCKVIWIWEWMMAAWKIIKNIIPIFVSGNKWCSEIGGGGEENYRNAQYIPLWFLIYDMTQESFLLMSSDNCFFFLRISCSFGEVQWRGTCNKGKIRYRKRVRKRLKNTWRKNRGSFHKYITNDHECAQILYA